MFKVFKEFYLIRKFPRGFSWYKKILVIVGFLFLRLIIHRRKNELTFKDLFKANLLLRKGDIVLCGEHETVLSDLIGGAVDHSVLYVGNRRFIEAIGKGVGYVSFHKLFTLYHSIVILRTVEGTPQRVIRDAIDFAKSKVGKPYNYKFSKKCEGFFCSQLVNEAYKKVGYRTGLRSLSIADTPKKKLEAMIHKAANGLRPDRIVKGNFRVIFLSHNLGLKGKKLYMKKSSKNI